MELDPEESRLSESFGPSVQALTLVHSPVLSPILYQMEWLMAAWVSATTQNGQKIFMNLDLAETVVRLPERFTRISFPGRLDDYLEVKEEPADLFARAGFAVPTSSI